MKWANKIISSWLRESVFKKIELREPGARMMRPFYVHNDYKIIDDSKSKQHDAEVIEFRPGGVIRHRDAVLWEGSEETGGSWRQFGPWVVLTINNFSVHFGTARADAIALRGRLIAVERYPSYWHWTLTPPPGPDGRGEPAA